MITPDILATYGEQLTEALGYTDGKRASLTWTILPRDEDSPAHYRVICYIHEGSNRIERASVLVSDMMAEYEAEELLGDVVQVFATNLSNGGFSIPEATPAD